MVRLGVAWRLMLRYLQYQREVQVGNGGEEEEEGEGGLTPSMFRPH